MLEVVIRTILIVRQLGKQLNEVKMQLKRTLSLVLVVVLIAVNGHAQVQESRKPFPATARVALDGDCCVSLVEMQAYVKGEEAFSSHWRGLRYLFLSEEEKVVFDSNPEKYAMAFGGLDIVATYGLAGPLEEAKKVYGAGRNTHRFDGQTFQFATEENRRRFIKDSEEYVSRAKRTAYEQAEAKRGKSLSELYPGK